MNVNNGGNFKSIKQSYFQYSDPLPQREKSRVSIQFCRDNIRESAGYSWLRKLRITRKSICA